MNTLTLREKDHILKALEDSNWAVGGKSGAAARLGVARTTLIHKNAQARTFARNGQEIAVSSHERTSNLCRSFSEGGAAISFPTDQRQ
jgi:hypothetical protein